MQSGAHLLKAWIKRRGYKQVEAAAELEIHEALMSMLVNGHRMPTLFNAVKIERLTGIPVTVWSSSASDKSMKAGQRKRRQVQSSQTVNG